jgi:hypothetical protein
MEQLRRRVNHHCIMIVRCVSCGGWIENGTLPIWAGVKAPAQSTPAEQVRQRGRDCRSITSAPALSACTDIDFPYVSKLLLPAPRDSNPSFSGVFIRLGDGCLTA